MRARSRVPELSPSLHELQLRVSKAEGSGDGGRLHMDTWQGESTCDDDDLYVEDTQIPKTQDGSGHILSSNQEPPLEALVDTDRTMSNNAEEQEGAAVQYLNLHVQLSPIATVHDDRSVVGCHRICGRMLHCKRPSKLWKMATG